MQPVITHPRIEPALGLANAYDAVGGNAETGQTLGVRLHMRLAEKPAIHPKCAQMVSHRHFANADRKLVPSGPVA